ncbi:rhomboid protease GluP [Paraburkholderia fungorum]|uniref:Rhomboid protease GluP n=1 Tax=Paraburkholderia fungorum TaxID=134537 RepID=A0A1H1I170_9BURK|nr:rhomboid family intramembrane serine protease [Paraburkholderia fungorum]SDR31410.1 rhomboid protease GluP [Paraburkholderia fungorum]
MDRIDTAPGETGHTLGASAYADRHDMQSFSVRLSIKPRDAGIFSANRYALRIKSELTFSDDEILLRRANASETRSVHRDEVFDIDFNEGVLLFDLHSPQRAIERVELIPRSAEDLQRIVDLLPVRMTPEFAAQRIAHKTYRQRLLALTPVPRATYALVVLNVLVLIAMGVSGINVLMPDAAEVARWGTNLGAYTLNGEPWRLFTAIFVHFGLQHLVGNMIVLFMLGRTTERLYGSLRFLALYVFAGLIGSIASVLTHPGLNSAGASGAIFGVAGALLIFVLVYRRQLPPSEAARLRTSMWIFILYTLYNGFRHSQVDNAAHLGGLIGGLVIGALLARPLELDARQRNSFRTAVASWTVALLSLAALSYPLTHMSASRLADAQFSRLMVEARQTQNRMRADLIAWRHLRLASQVDRDVASNRIMREILPGWNSMYESISSAQMPEGSPRAPLRQAMLRYIDDNREIYRSLAIMLSHPQDMDAAAMAPVLARAKDAKEQAVLMKKLEQQASSQPR